MRRWLALALLGGLWLGTGSLQAQPASVLLLRHAEKPPEETNPHLSAEGRVRADWLASWLTTSPEAAREGPPQILVAAAATVHGHGQRTRETLEPLSRRLGIAVRTPQTAKDYKALARWLLTSPECRGKRVVVCWTHEFLPQLAAALGRTPQPAPWHGSDFDHVWRVRWEPGQTRWEELRQPLRSEKTPKESRSGHHKSASGD